MTKQKLLQTITTGISNLQLNEIGNAYLHKHNKVGITPIKKSRQGRAIVYDQHLIDRLFIDSHIDEQQHNVLNKYLEVKKFHQLLELFHQQNYLLRKV